MDGDINIVTEICASLQVSVIEDVSVQISLSPDAVVGSSLDVTGVIHQTGIDFQGGAAVCLVCLDGANRFVLVEQRNRLVVILLFAVLVKVHTGILHFAKGPVPEVDAGGPVQIVRDTALNIGKNAEHIAAHSVVVEIVITNQGIPVGPHIIVLNGSGTVEAPETVQGVGHISHGCVHTHTGNQIL